MPNWNLIFSQLQMNVVTGVVLFFSRSATFSLDEEFLEDDYFSEPVCAP